jgi:hypothetical protein
MKIYHVIIFFLLIFSTSIFSQEFEVWAENEQINGNLGEELIFNIEVENTSQDDITLSIVREKNDIPEQWSSSLCFEFCFAPFVDSISTTSDFGSSPISPGEIRDLSLHVFPQEVNGLGEIEILIKNLNNFDYDTTLVFTASTAITPVEDEIAPNKFELKQNYPNPFNPSTIINFSLPVSDKVTLKVYDVIGNEVAVLINSIKSAGSFDIKFNASSLPSGIYFYELKTSEFRSVRKMVLEK